jgi:hypothetical protein
MRPGHGEVLLAEGDVTVAEDEQALIEEFRRQLDSGMGAGARRNWSARSTRSPATRNA